MVMNPKNHPPSLGLIGALIAVIQMASTHAAIDAHLARSAPGKSKATPVRPQTDWCSLPIQFEANQGQADPQYRFLARGSEFNLLLSVSGSVIQWPAHEPLRIRLADADPTTTLTALDPLPAQANYLLGPDPSRWTTRVPTYGKVQWAQPYPGVDLVLYGHHRELEYDFRLAPGANPALIRWSFEGASEVSIDPQGALVLKTAGGTLKHHAPLAYQEVNGGRQIVPAQFKTFASAKGASETLVGFELGAYDGKLPLIIDPVLEFSTFMGGTGEDRAYGVAVDARGAVYVIGQSTSPNFPLANPVQNTLAGGFDVFVVKIDPVAHGVAYSTLLGGSGDDKGCSLAVDSAGNAVITGITQSTNFPMARAFQEKFGGGDRDGFMAKLSSAGNELVFSSYLGGSGSDDAISVAVGPGDVISIVGGTSSIDFPVQGALQATKRGKYNCFVAQFSRDGFMNYGTYLGGNGDFDSALGVAMDASGNSYVAGFTSSTNFPLRQPWQTVNHGGYDAFVAKINPKGTELLYSTYLGGSADDTARSIVVDRDGNAYISGDTFSTNFPVTNALQSVNGGRRDVFLTKINAAGSELVYSTYLGGSGEEMAALAVDEDRCAYITGVTSSTNFPILNAVQPQFGGGFWDAFVAKINPGGKGLVYSTFLGGEGIDQSSAIAVHAGGIAYLVGASVSTNFPTLNPLQTKHRRGGHDAFLAKITEKATEAIEAYTNNIVLAKAPADVPAANAPKSPAAVNKDGTSGKTRPATPATPATPPALVSEDKLLTHPIFGRNIIVNSGAEAGPAATSSYGKTNVPGWTISGNLIALKYGTPGGFPTTNSPGPTDRGLNFFVGGPESAVSTASQTIDLNEIAPLIDGGWVAYKFGAFLGGVGGQKDQGLLQLVFQDADNGFLGQVAVGPVTINDRQYKTGLLWRSTTGQIPPQTRKLEVRLQFNRADGKYNDAFADNLGLILMPTKPAK
jgi:hypothetical protein